MGPEKTFELSVRRYLHSRGIYEQGTPVQKRRVPTCGWYLKVAGGAVQRAGVPDLVICVRGHFLAVELKASHGRPSALQRLTLGHLKAAGADAILLYPDHFEAFKQLIDGYVGRVTGG